LAAQSLDRWSEVPWCSGYFFRRRSTPAVPCVIEDVIARLSAETGRAGIQTADVEVAQDHYSRAPSTDQPTTQLLGAPPRVQGGAWREADRASADAV